MSSEESIRPLYDVWLRPRRVFRELSTQPVNHVDYALGALQGIVGWFGVCRSQNLGAHTSVINILGQSLLLGSIFGIASLHLMGLIYARLGPRAGKANTRAQVVHVLAYGSVPVVATLPIWLITTLLAGEDTFTLSPTDEVEGFVSLLLQAQLIACLFLAGWSVLLQVMGLSEIQRVTTGRALLLWLLGLLLTYLAMLFLYLLLTTIVPGTPIG